jgi:hypothetical protein
LHGRVIGSADNFAGPDSIARAYRIHRSRYRGGTSDHHLVCENDGRKRDHQGDDQRWHKKNFLASHSIALIRKFFEAPLLALGGLLFSSNRQANIFIFSSEGLAQKSLFSSEANAQKRRYLIRNYGDLIGRLWIYAEKASVSRGPSSFG